jgi:hypothetical protein
LAGAVDSLAGLAVAAGAASSAPPAGVEPVDAQPASRLMPKSMVNKTWLLGFIDGLHLTGLDAGVALLCVSFLKLPYR